MDVSAARIYGSGGNGMEQKKRFLCVQKKKYSYVEVKPKKSERVR